MRGNSGCLKYDGLYLQEWNMKIQRRPEWHLYNDLPSLKLKLFALKMDDWRKSSSLLGPGRHNFSGACKLLLVLGRVDWNWKTLFWCNTWILFFGGSISWLIHSKTTSNQTLVWTHIFFNMFSSNFNDLLSMKFWKKIKSSEFPTSFSTNFCETFWHNKCCEMTLPWVTNR